jgi:hypothetical protein
MQPRYSRISQCHETGIREIIPACRQLRDVFCGTGVLCARRHRNRQSNPTACPRQRDPATGRTSSYLASDVFAAAAYLVTAVSSPKREIVLGHDYRPLALASFNRVGPPPSPPSIRELLPVRVTRTHTCPRKAHQGGKKGAVANIASKPSIHRPDEEADVRGGTQAPKTRYSAPTDTGYW